MKDYAREAAAGVRPTWSVGTRGGYIGVIKELGTDAWRWHCSRLHDNHPNRKEAIACARAHIAEEVRRGRSG